MPLVRGIDVHPSYQTVTDWGKVAGAVDFMIQKATEHTTFRTSNMYYKTAKAKGLLVGAYHFFRPGKGSATDQADWFVAWLRAAGWQKGRDLPPVLDLERDDDLSDATVRARAAVFLNRVDSVLGLGSDPWQRTMLYMNASWRDRMNGLHHGRVLWLASWPAEFDHAWPTRETSKPSGAGIWQFTDNGGGMVPGITNGGPQSLDLDVAVQAELAKMAPLFYNDGKEEDMDLTPANLAAIGKAVWDHKREVSASACKLAGWPDGFDASAWNLLSGADAAEVALLALARSEEARDAVQAQVLAGIQQATAGRLSTEEAREVADLVTANLVRIVVEPGQTAAGA
jgi:GH25 family lysozyme M1 (1,4-beta-N-acetylmuramidase)